MFSTTKTIDPDMLISLLVEESDCQQAQYARQKTGGKGKEGEMMRRSVLHRIKARHQERMSNAGIVVRRVTSVTSARNQRKPTQKGTNPKRASPRKKPNQMAERTLLNPTQKVKEHGR